MIHSKIQAENEQNSDSQVFRLTGNGFWECTQTLHFAQRVQNLKVCLNFQNKHGCVLPWLSSYSLNSIFKCTGSIYCSYTISSWQTRRSSLHSEKLWGVFPPIHSRSVTLWLCLSLPVRLPLTLNRLSKVCVCLYPHSWLFNHLCCRCADMDFHTPVVFLSIWYKV